MKKGLLLIFAILASFMLVACNNTSEKSENLKVALVLTGQSNDGGWNQVAYDGIKMAEDKIGAELSFSESVKASDYERVIRDYAKSGNDVIIGHGFEFSDAIAKVSEDFPKIVFLISDTELFNDTNLGSYATNNVETGFLQGAFAALMTKTNTVGAIGGMEIPPIVATVNGFGAGAKYINPNIKVVSAYVGNFDDAIKGKELALTMIDQGVDLIMTNADQAGVGVYNAAEDKNIWSIGTIKPEFDKYPSNLIACSSVDLANAIFVTLNEINDGAYESGYQTFGLKEGINSFEYNTKLETNVSNEVKTKMADIEKLIISGEINLKELVK